ncbi:hypothetical protein DYB36_006646 [Aphanomyces astaci]|uniref:USP domain-containing protein n=1 Tax=Aphanomyces astaci TaxID=112090 RepID=A0A397BAX2_APHAT|nr:hypothetical protein DYB36_006646 [Aphanomyces astaci]
MKRKDVTTDAAAQQALSKRKKCPYLDTIRPQLLDFDFEKVCSISLSDQNAYACLVCGKYFQGRGPNTHAFTHSVQSFHHVFINLSTDKIYCLPDNYEVTDLSLAPIKNALRPSFTPEYTASLDTNRTLAQDSFGVSYLPGFIGLNNLKKTDYISVVLQALAHVTPLRDYFLQPDNYAAAVAKTRSPLVLRFGELIRKLWSPHNIKNTVRSQFYYFSYLTLDLPPTPLFKDSQGGNVIPQVPLFTVLEKFDGDKITHVLHGATRQHKQYSIDSLPPYLIFHIHRFTKNNFFTEKNPTIVNFPVKNLELKEYVASRVPTAAEVDAMTTTELNALLSHCGGTSAGIVDKADLVAHVHKHVAKASQTKYNLIANICHDSPVTIGKETTAVNMDPLADGTYRVHVQNRSTDQWYEVQDLHVQETMPQLIGISESYVLIYERKDGP